MPAATNGRTLSPDAVVEVRLPADGLIRERLPADVDVVRRLALEDRSELGLEVARSLQAGVGSRLPRSDTGALPLEPLTELGVRGRFGKRLAVEAVVVKDGA